MTSAVGPTYPEFPGGRAGETETVTGDPAGTTYLITSSPLFCSAFPYRLMSPRSSRVNVLDLSEQYRKHGSVVKNGPPRRPIAPRGAGPKKIFC